MNTRYIPSNLNFEESFTSFEILSRPTAFTTKTQVANAATGIISELVRKSKKSSISMPKILTKDKPLYPRDERDPSTTMIIATRPVALVLPMPSSSWNVDAHVSAREMALVRAAKSTRTKNRIPTACPSPMLSNTLGMVTNMSPGPLFSMLGSPPENANTAGMIISPASTAIPLSKKIT